MSLEKDMTLVNARMNLKLAEMIKELSRLKYGKDRAIIEADMKIRAKL
jgi:hypothetical protein